MPLLGEGVARHFFGKPPSFFCDNVRKLLPLKLRQSSGMKPWFMDETMRPPEERSGPAKGSKL
jgi:hypothetical protein